MRIQPIGPASVPISLEIVKAHLRLDADVGTEEDALLGVYLRGAVAEAERSTRRKIAGQRYLLSEVDAAPSIVLPVFPVATVTKIAGPDGEVDPGDYELHAELLPQEIRFATVPAGPLSIEVDAGHAPADLPDDVASLILLLTGHRYENREAVVTGTIATPIPRAVHDLVWLLRVGL